MINHRHLFSGLSKFLAQEQPLGNLPISSKTTGSFPELKGTDLQATANASTIFPFVDVEPLASVAPVDVPSPTTIVRWNGKRYCLEHSVEIVPSVLK